MLINNDNQRIKRKFLGFSIMEKNSSFPSLSLIHREHKFTLLQQFLFYLMYLQLHQAYQNIILWIL